MRQRHWRFRGRIGMLWIGLFWLTVSCAGKPPSGNPGLDTAQCDSKVRSDCVSVSEAFVTNRLLDEDTIVRLLLDLDSCRHHR